MRFIGAGMYWMVVSRKGQFWLQEVDFYFRHHFVVRGL